MTVLMTMTDPASMVVLMRVWTGMQGKQKGSSAVTKAGGGDWQRGSERLLSVTNAVRRGS